MEHWNIDRSQPPEIFLKPIIPAFLYSMIPVSLFQF